MSDQELEGPGDGGRMVEAKTEVTASREAAYEAWADPERLAGWFVDRARGRAEKGGTMTWEFERFGLEVPHRVLEAVPGERIVFAPVGIRGSEILEVGIARGGGGATRIRVVNSGFSADADFDEQFAGIASGWAMALGALKEYLERHDGESRAQFMVLRPATREAAEVVRRFVEPAALGAWLGAPDGEVGGVGSRVRMDLLDGGTLTGRVLARTDREVSMAWTEIGGVLELKAFVAGEERMVGVRGWGWGMEAGRAAELESRMERAVDRLALVLAPA